MRLHLYPCLILHNYIIIASQFCEKVRKSCVCKKEQKGEREREREREREMEKEGLGMKIIIALNL